MKFAYGVFALALAVMQVTALAARQHDGAVIQNSGSTNTAPFTIRVWSDGSAESSTQHARIDKSIVDKFFADAKAMKAEGKTSTRTGCMKSASFGSSTFVHYHGWTSGDLECAAGGILAADVHAIAGALHLPGLKGHRIPMLPNEPRRPEAVPTQASPTPESTQPAP